MLKREEIRIRDPFILVDKKEKVYYMYGTTELGNWMEAGCKFSAYKSRDLENFEGPFVIFNAEEQDFWADKDFWAPEVHFYKGKYYLFGSFYADGKNRGVHILVCDTPLGTFRPLTKEPISPKGWECLDGTLWIENGKPYMVFSHEWLQIVDGAICAMELSEDLTRAVSEPVLLFNASDNHLVDTFYHEGLGDQCRVTDGPFLFKEDGKLKMIWSSHINGRYSVIEAESDSLLGKWKHGGKKFEFDGGHAMIFEDLNGEKRISLHKPNTPKGERATFIKLKL